MLRFFRNIWFFLTMDMSKIHSYATSYYALKVEVAELQLYRRKLSEEKIKNNELKRLNRVLEMKSDRELNFEKKAPLHLHLRRWAREVEGSPTLAREIAMMAEALDIAHQKIPVSTKTSEVKEVHHARKKGPVVGLGGSMR